MLKSANSMAASFRLGEYHLMERYEPMMPSPTGPMLDVRIAGFRGWIVVVVDEHYPTSESAVVTVVSTTEVQLAIANVSHDSHYPGCTLRLRLTGVQQISVQRLYLIYSSMVFAANGCSKDL